MNRLDLIGARVRLVGSGNLIDGTVLDAWDTNHRQNTYGQPVLIVHLWQYPVWCQTVLDLEMVEFVGLPVEPLQLE